jgi:RimJ/RimL family protein N-acetyltransferase
LSEPIRTERLQLVPVDVATARSIGNGELSGFVAGKNWPQSSQTLEALAFVVRNGANACWLLLLDGVVIGHVFWKGGPSPDGAAEIGYGLAAPYRQRGYATEAVVAFAGWALGQPGVRRLVAETLADNTPSRRVLERAGFAITSVADGYVYWERVCAS